MKITLLLIPIFFFSSCSILQKKSDTPDTLIAPKNKQEQAVNEAKDAIITNSWRYLWPLVVQTILKNIPKSDGYRLANVKDVSEKIIEFSVLPPCAEQCGDEENHRYYNGKFYTDSWIIRIYHNVDLVNEIKMLSAPSNFQWTLSIETLSNTWVIWQEWMYGFSLNNIGEYTYLVYNNRGIRFLKYTRFRADTSGKSIILNAENKVIVVTTSEEQWSSIFVFDKELTKIYNSWTENLIDITDVTSKNGEIFISYRSWTEKKNYTLPID